MIQDTDEGILSKSDLLMMRDHKLREFLYGWIIENPTSTGIVIEEQVVFGDYRSTASHKQASITFPINWVTFGLETLIDQIVQQLYDKITDVPWHKNIVDFVYTEVVFKGVNDFASLYPTVISNPKQTFTFTPDRYETRKQVIAKK